MICRLCGTSRLAPLLALDLPLSHRLRRSTADPAPCFRVEFRACQHCGLLQIPKPIDPGLLYSEDTYTTGFQRPRHAEDLVATVLARGNAGSAIDVGCNDGAFLDLLAREYEYVVGVEPNTAAAIAAQAKGHAVHDGYLTEDRAIQIRAAGLGRFSAVFARQVVEHVPDLGDFFRAIRRLMAPDGLLAIEMPDCEEAFRLGSPAILWEEHVSYFTPALAEYMLARHGFEIVDRRRYCFGGGTMAFVCRACEPRRREPPDVSCALGLLRHFRQRFDVVRKELARLVSVAHAEGRRVMLYGAAPRSCMMVASSGIGDELDYVVDDRAELQGRLMPGTDLPIQSPYDVPPGQPLLCLLGVGAENEARVRAKVEAVTSGAVYVSLFPPRDLIGAA